MEQNNYSTIDNPYDEMMRRSDPLGSGTASTDSSSDSGENIAAKTLTSPGGGSGGVADPTAADQIAEAGGIIKSGSTIKDAWIATWLKSQNYQPKTQGFMIDARLGYIEAMKLFVGSGGIIGGSLDIPDDTSANSFHVDSAGNMWLGAVLFADAPFSVTNAGALKATSGTIGGNVLASNSISSNPFVSGPLGAGWRIQSTGEAEFQNVSIRGTIRTSVFEKDTISAVNGMVLVSKADILASDMTALDASTLTVSGQTAFVANEVIRIKDGTDDEWMLVTSAASAPTYTVTRDLAGAYASNTNPVWTKGTAVVSMGVGTGTKTGFVLIDSSSASSPYIDVYGRNSNTYTDYTLHGRFGWLQGITDSEVGLSSTDVWGLYTDNAYLKGTIVASAGRIGGTTNYWNITAGSLAAVGSGDVEIRGGQTAYETGTGFWLGLDAGTAKMSLGGSSSYLKWNGTNLEVLGTFITGTVGGARGEFSSSQMKFYDADNDLQVSLSAGGLNFRDNDGNVQNSIYSDDTLGLILQDDDGDHPLLVNSDTFFFKSIEPWEGEDVDIGFNDPDRRFRTIYLVNSPDVSSSREGKENIKPVSYGLETILQMEPVSFTRKTGRAKVKNIENPRFSKKRLAAVSDTVHLGFIAEDLNKIAPEIASPDSMRPDYMLPVLVKAVQELAEKVEKLEKKK